LKRVSGFCWRTHRKKEREEKREETGRTKRGGEGGEDEKQKEKNWKRGGYMGWGLTRHEFISVRCSSHISGLKEYVRFVDEQYSVPELAAIKCFHETFLDCVGFSAEVACAQRVQRHARLFSHFTHESI